MYIAKKEQEITCFSISLITIKPWGLIFAPGTFDSAGFKKLLKSSFLGHFNDNGDDNGDDDDGDDVDLGMPVVRFISLFANGQSDTQWFPRHLQ